ncbi:MAG TPA: PAS domain S-box protein [Pyrinomonadaceae bacterium]|jgi:PAS domain S-box-containing protein|nr:PAS domain S-box protein [Pyrinomonadaceae bacterium]
MTKEISQDSQDLFRLIAENVRDFAVFMTDPEGRVLSWNPGVESLLGYAEGEWVGRDASIIFTPEDREQGEHLSEMETALREGRAEDKRWHLHRDGSRFWADGFLMLLKDGRGEARGFAKILRDDTEAKLTEERLRESEERFQRVVELSPDAIAVHAEGVVLFINTTGAKLLRAEGPEQIVGKPIAGLIHPDYHEIIRGRIEKASRGEASPPAEIKFVRLDGTELYGELASAPLLYQGRPALQAVVRDLTRRKQAEQTLRESEKRFRLIFNQQFQFMAILSPEGVLLDVNELPLRAAGVTREQVLGRLFWETPWWEGLPEMQAGWPARLAEAARSDGPVFTVDLYRAADGTRIADASVTAVRDSDGRVEFFIVQASDITERKRAEEERERLLREAQEANRLKDEFLATVSHELRTPLTAILGWAHLLRGGGLKAGAVSKALETIERNARSQSQLIDDLLDVSRIVTGKLRLDVVPVSPSTFIDAAVEAVRPAAEAKGVRLQKLIDTGVQTVMVDPARLQQVVWNLLTNAVKFTPRGGLVQMRLERVNSQVEMSVTDTGAGIDPEFLPHVFERFRQADQRTTRQHGGLGLGLAIVRHLVELHGGTVRADSGGEGAGSTFTVSLPVAPIHRREEAQEGARPAAIETLPAHECPERLDGLRVLVVDDEPDARELLAVGLGQCGAEVVTASSAHEALRAMAGGAFDVLVSDIGMPGEDGYELIRMVRALPAGGGGGTPAVALTAYARTEDRLRAMRAGFEMHVSKPVELTELVVVVANLARRGSQS